MRFGVYIHDGFTFEPRAECPYHWGIGEYERYLDWLAASGVEMVELWPQAGWYRYPALPGELDRLRARQQLVDAAHRRGMELMLLLTTNLYSKLPTDELPPGQASINEADTTWCPQDPIAFERTAAVSEYFSRAYRGLDHVDVFAGDWGGCDCGRCDVGDFERYVDRLAATVTGEQPDATVWANVWSISSWQQRPYDFVTDATGTGGWRRFWDDEITFSDDFLSRLADRPAGLGLGFPLHHWYRGLTQRGYGEHDLPTWPEGAVLDGLHASGHPLMAWTHFIVENDPYHGDLWGTLSVRLRYIRRLAQRVTAAPFDLVMANVYSARQALNLFAYATWVREPDGSVESVLAAFVDEVASPSGRQLLTDVLVHLENRDPWERDLPDWSREPPLPEDGVDVAAIERALPDLATHLRDDSPLLLNGATGFARTASEAFARAALRASIAR